MIMSFNSGGGKIKKRLGQTGMAGAAMPLVRTQCLTLTWAMVALEVDKEWPCRSLAL